MTHQELQDFLKASTGLPWAYHHFEKPPGIPFGVFADIAPTEIYADNTTYHRGNAYRLELYSVVRDVDYETMLEAALTAADIPYEVDYTYITSEKMYETIYEIEV